jgi:hypothetical protein
MMRAAAWIVLTTATVSGACGTPPISSPSPRFDVLRDRYPEAKMTALFERDFSAETFWSAVGPAVTSSPDLERVEVGRSAEGRPLYRVSFGRGTTSVLLWSQMHGDESTASMALADLIGLVGQEPDHPALRPVLDGLRVHLVPVVNPDGAARFQRRNAQGIDINRDARRLATPEARALRAVHQDVDPAFGFNLHDQAVGTRVGESDRGAAIALLSPPFDDSRAVNDVRRAAMQVAGVIRNAIEPMVGDHIARYDDTFNPRAFGDLMTQWGTSTVLIESGGWTDDPQKQFLREANFVAILAALNAIATGSYRDVDVDRYTSLPMNGRRISDLLVKGGMLVLPGLDPIPADLRIDYDRPLLRTGGTIVEIGDLMDAEARDTFDVTGLYVVPRPSALDSTSVGPQLQPGATADFDVSRDPTGEDRVWTFLGGTRSSPDGR